MYNYKNSIINRLEEKKLYLNELGILNDRVA